MKKVSLLICLVALAFLLSACNEKDKAMVGVVFESAEDAFSVSFIGSSLPFRDGEELVELEEIVITDEVSVIRHLPGAANGNPYADYVIKHNENIIYTKDDMQGGEYIEINCGKLLSRDVVLIREHSPWGCKSCGTLRKSTLFINGEHIMTTTYIYEVRRIPEEDIILVKVGTYKYNIYIMAM